MCPHTSPSMYTRVTTDSQAFTHITQRETWAKVSEALTQCFQSQVLHKRPAGHLRLTNMDPRKERSMAVPGCGQVSRGCSSHRAAFHCIYIKFAGALTAHRVRPFLGYQQPVLKYESGYTSISTGKLH